MKKINITVLILGLLAGATALASNGIFRSVKAESKGSEIEIVWKTDADATFHTYEVDLEVNDLAHLTRIVSALRASEAVAQAERI